MRFSSVSASARLRFAEKAPQEEEEPLDQLVRKSIHIRSTGGRRASPMSSALKMYAR
tara:strand:- start:1816 stop:1986 length:171 start_codon:yes stop_codon:yes gene_type:complete